MKNPEIQATTDANVQVTGKPTLILGASLKSHRASNTAIQMLRDTGHSVYALGLRAGRVADVDIATSLADLDLPPLHTITLYLNAQRQTAFYDTIFDLQPKRLIFNPGAENPELKALATERGIECVEACTLVLISSHWF
ncbi:MAG: CoA-binding protein [Bacteroidota bacterium]